MNLYWPCQTWMPQLFDSTVLSFLACVVNLLPTAWDFPDCTPSSAFPGSPSQHSRSLCMLPSPSTTAQVLPQQQDAWHRDTAVTGTLGYGHSSGACMHVLLQPWPPSMCPPNYRETWSESISSGKRLPVVTPMWYHFSWVKQYRRRGTVVFGGVVFTHQTIQSQVATAGDAGYRCLLKH